MRQPEVSGRLSGTFSAGERGTQALERPCVRDSDRILSLGKQVVDLFTGLGIAVLLTSNAFNLRIGLERIGLGLSISIRLIDFGQSLLNGRSSSALIEQRACWSKKGNHRNRQDHQDDRGDDPCGSS